MAVGKSRRIVIDVDDVAFKRRLYAALAEDGCSLKDWFVAAAGDYLGSRAPGRQLDLGVGVAEDSPPYGQTVKGKTRE